MKCFIHCCVLHLQAVSTVSGDHNRFNERVAQIKARPKTEWVPKPWPPKSKYTAILNFPQTCEQQASEFLHLAHIHYQPKKYEYILSFDHHNINNH